MRSPRRVATVVYRWTALRSIDVPALLLLAAVAPAARLQAEDAPAAVAPTQPQAVASPLSPEDALKTFQTDPGLRVELVAAEPLVESPVAVAFDARGRMYVAENRGYPTGPATAGRVAMLHDSDGDGRFDRRTDFADGLNYPNGLMPLGAGLLVTCVPDLIYLEDRDGDGRADLREVLLTGFSTRANTQHGESHPQLGLDGWLYVTGGLTGGHITSPKNRDHGPVEFGRADFRFLPDCSRFEAADGGGQFGMSLDDFGRRFICYNRVQIQHVVLPGRYLRRNPNLNFSATVQDCPAEMTAEPLKGHGASARLYPLSRNITTADSHAGTFTAACGLMIYRSSALPAAYRGGAFSCDPTANLVHFDRLEPAGATFAARRFESQSEVLASPDDWFRPVDLAQGPDGAVYVCDMYRRTIEHPDYLPVEIRQHTDFEGGKGMGRIWRISWADIDPAELDRRLKVDLAGQTGEQLCQLLSAPDSWHRDTARRLLWERRDAGVVPTLKRLIASPDPLARANALSLLDNYEQLTEAIIWARLADDTPGVRELAIQLAEPRLEAMPSLVERLSTLAVDPDARVRFQCTLTLGEARSTPIEPLVRIALAGGSDRWTRAAVESSIAGHELDFMGKLGSIKTPATPVESGTTEPLFVDLGRLIAATAKPEDWQEGLRIIVTAVDKRDFLDQAAAAVGFSEGLRRRRAASPTASLAALADGTKNKKPDTFVWLSRLLADAQKIAVNRGSALERRVAAVRLLADGDPATVAALLLSLVDPHEPSEVEIAAVGSLGNLDDPAPATQLVEAARFASYTPPLRETVLSTMLSSAKLQAALLSAIESGAVPIGMIDSLRRKQLTGSRDPELRERAAKVFAASAVGNRATVYEDYKSVAQMAGDAKHGHEVFLKSCANCHRLDREGTPVGPDLFGIRNQPKEAILLHILIPEYEITPGFGAYLVETTDGRVLAGLLVGETPTQITLRAAFGREETVLRSDIESLALSKLSLMPQELEKAMSRQDLADLVAYLKGEQ